jgi:hypothetical protein
MQGSRGASGAGGKELSLPNGFQKSEFIHGRKDLICIQARTACMQGINIQAPGFNSWGCSPAI